MVLFNRDFELSEIDLRYKVDIFLVVNILSVICFFISEERVGIFFMCYLSCFREKLVECVYFAFLFNLLFGNLVIAYC